MRSNLYFIVKHACGDVAFESAGRDYTLQQIVDLLHAQGHASAVATAEAIILEGITFLMYASVCNEAGHNLYSRHRQWYPVCCFTV